MKIKIRFIYICLFLMVQVFGQKLSTSITKQKIKIGEPFEYILEINQNKDNQVIKQFKKQISNSKFEMISFKVDSINNKNKFSYYFKLTSYEEGNNKIPSLKLNINKDILETSVYSVFVIPVKIDENKHKDIKNIEEVDMNFMDYLNLYKNYILYFILFLIIIFIIYWIFKFRNRQKNISQKDIFEQSIYNLNKLEKSNYIKNQDFKSFYSELSDIFKNFVDSYFEIPAKVLISNDLIEFIKEKEILENQDFNQIKDFINLSDFVKFAKFVPTEKDSENHFNIIKNLIINEYEKYKIIKEQEKNQSKK